MTVPNEEWEDLVADIKDLWERHKHTLKQQDEVILKLTLVSSNIRDNPKISNTEARQQLELFRTVKAETTKLSRYSTTGNAEWNIRFEYSLKLIDEIIRRLGAILRT